jgi:DNA polymerase-1
MLLALLRERRPDYLAMVLDVGDETTFRRELDENYKANRDPAPEALHVQADRITEIVKTVGIPIYRLPGFEADDLMATIAHRLHDEDVDVYLVSRDKDLEQLITQHVRLFDVAKADVIDAAVLQDKKGYSPEQAVEIQTLTGDSTDNVPGVQGVGVKTAAKLIAEYGSAKAVVDNAEKLTAKMRERMQAFSGQLPLTRQLVTLRRDAPVEFDLADCPTDRIDLAAARPIFEELGFSRLKEQIDILTDGAEAEPGLEAVTPLRTEGSTDYHLIDTPEAFDAFVDKLARQSSFAFDTETTGLNPVAADLVGLSFSWKAGEAYYLPVRAAVGSVLPVDAVVKKLEPILEDPSIEKTGQNVKYDMLVLRQVGIETTGIAFDTMVAAFLLDPLARSRSIDFLARSLLDHEMIPISDLIGKGKNQITIDQVETNRVCEYASEDADYTWRLKEVLAERMTGSHAEPLFRDTEMPLVEVLAEMEHNGIALDIPLLAELGQSLAQRMDELTDEVHQVAGHPFNIDSTKQLAAVLFDEQGLEVVRKTKTGRSTDAETLQTLAARTENPIPRLVLEYRELAKLRGTYVETLPKMVCRRTGRLHASFDQAGAITGRLSSRDPNLQNIPVRTDTGRRIREAFIAGDPDAVMLTADYSQIELRLLAHLCEDKALIEAFRSGQDIHRTVAAEVNAVSPDEVTPAQRSAAKAVNFGIVYGQSAFGLSRALGIPVGKAKAFIDAYFERYPGIRSFIDECVDAAREKGYAETILGRRRPIPELQSRNRQQVSMGERIAVNTVVQGSAADLIKRAMIDIHRAYKTGEHEAKMLIQVHDELVFEVPTSRVEQDAKLIKGKMEHAMALRVPLVADIAWARTWAESK